MEEKEESGGKIKSNDKLKAKLKHKKKHFSAYKLKFKAAKYLQDKLHYKTHAKLLKIRANFKESNKILAKSFNILSKITKDMSLGKFKTYSKEIKEIKDTITISTRKYKYKTFNRRLWFILYVKKYWEDSQEFFDKVDKVWLSLDLEDRKYFTEYMDVLINEEK